MRRLARALALIAALASPVQATTRYIAVGGTATYSNAQNSGTPMSLATANSGATPGDSLVLAAGTYADPIQPHADGLSNARIVYAGSAASPTSASVARILFGAESSAQGNVTWGNYATVRWVFSRDAMLENVHLRPGKPWHACDNVIAVGVSGVGSVSMCGTRTLYDSCAFTGDGRFTMEPHPGTYPAFDWLAVDNTVKNCNFNWTGTGGGSGNNWFFEGRRTRRLAVLNNDFTFTSTHSNSGYVAFFQFYLTQKMNFNDNRITIVDNSTSSGTKLVFSLRDTSQGNQSFRNTWNVSGTATKPPTFYGSNGGSFSGTVRDNRWEGNTIKTSCALAAAFYYENGASKDTLRFNVIATDRSIPAFATNLNVRFDTCLVAHNALTANNGVVAYIDTSTANSGSKFVSDILYGTTANSLGSPTLIVPTTVALDSVGLLFSRSGSSGFAIRRKGAAPAAPASGAGYGIATKAVWNTPQFLDSVYATLDARLRTGSPADDDNLHDGFAGALGVGTGPPPDVTPPNDIIDLSVINAGTTSMTLQWTAPGDDGPVGQADKYDVRYSTSTITSGNFASATEATGEPTPKPAGAIESFTVTGLSPATTYYFAMKTSDGTPNTSGLSNVASNTTGGATSAITSMQLRAGINSIGVRVFVTGDADSDAVVRLFYRKWSDVTVQEETNGPTLAGYDSSTVCFRRPGGGGHDGAIFWCDSLTKYQILAELTDPDGGVTTISDTISTRNPSPIRVKGPLVYVKKTGSDALDGLTEANAKLTIASARAKLISLPSQGRGGGLCFIGAGAADSSIWQENLTWTTGNTTPDSGYNVVVKQGTGRVIIDGALRKTFTWTAVAGTDSIWKASYSGDDSTVVLFIGYGHRLHKKSSFTELEQNFGAQQEGWFGNGDSLYVKTADGLTPGNSTLFNVGYLDRLVWLQMPYIRLDSLEIRYSGGKQNLGYGILMSGGPVVAGCVFSNLTIYGTAREGIYGYPYGVGTGVDSCIIRDCNIDGRGVWGWSYTACKSRECEHGAIATSGQGWSIFRNTFTNYFNGVEVNGEAADTTDGADYEIYSNSFNRNADDGLEFDTNYGINARFWWNNFDRNTNSCLSPNPVYNGGGPIWFVYNRCSGTIRGVKAGGTAGARMAIVNNTFAPAGTASSALYATGQPFWRQHWRNNIMLGWGDNAIRSLTAADSTGHGLNDFNYDMLDSTGGARLVRWKDGTGYSLVSFRSTFGWEKNGVHGRAAFVDSANRNLRLTSASAAISMAQRYPGINTEIPGRPWKQYVGAGPDAGAVEFDDERPARIATLSGVGYGTGAILYWTAVGDDSLTGTATTYTLYLIADTGICPTSNIGGDADASFVVTGTAPAGTPMSYDTGPGVLSNDLPQTFIVVATDDYGNPGAVSNCVTVTPTATPASIVATKQRTPGQHGRLRVHRR